MKKFVVVLCLALVALVSGCKGQDVEAGDSSPKAHQSAPVVVSSEPSSPALSEQGETSAKNDEAPVSNQSAAEDDSAVETTANGELVLHRVKGNFPEWLDSSSRAYWKSSTGFFSSAECKASFGPYEIEGPMPNSTGDPAWPGAKFYLAEDGIHVSFANRVPSGLLTSNEDSAGVIMTIALNLRPDFQHYFIPQDELGAVDLDMPAWRVSIGSVCGRR